MAQVQNIITGSIPVTSGSGTTVNETIASVTMAQSVVFMYFRSVNSNESRIKRELWTGQLTSPTNIQFTRHESSFAKNGTIEYTVVEWDSSVTVHRGSASPSTASSAHSIGATINTGSSFPIVTAKTDQNSISNVVACRASLSSTNITFDFDSAPGTNDCTIEWQIVEFASADADVQEGTVTISSGSASNTATITSVTTGNSFIVMGGLSTSNATSGEHRNQAIVELTNATTITATRTLRGSTQDQVVQYYVVEMNDGTTVESGKTTIAAGNNTPTTQPSFTAMSNPSVINTHFMQNDLNTDTTADHFTGDNYATVAINGTDDGVTITRDATDGALDVVWQAIDWNATGGGGGLTITVPLITTTPTLYAPEIIPDQLITASLLSTTPTVESPTLAAAYLIAIDEVTSETQVYDLSVANRQIISIERLLSGSALYSLIIDDGTGTIIPITSRQTLNQLYQFLKNQGYAGASNDLVVNWLIDEGQSRKPVNEMLKDYVVSKGHSPTISAGLSEWKKS